jgi:hypothetical protein
MGLDVPEGFKLARMLREDGMTITDHAKIEDIAEALANLIKGGDGDAT